MRSRIKGVARLRKKIARLPEAVGNETANRMNDVGDQMVAAMRSRVRRRTGLIASLIRRTRVSAKRLSLKAGIFGKAGRSKGFYQKFYEFGFQAGRTLVRRIINRSRLPTLQGRSLLAKRKAGSGVAVYYMNWKTRRAEYNIRGALGGKRAIGKTIIKGLLASAFRQAATGSGSSDN